MTVSLNINQAPTAPAAAPGRPPVAARPEVIAPRPQYLELKANVIASCSTG
ncbi:MAG TPA: hypothetical protein VF147_18850 [Vicinamibacterales bacterium]